MALFTCNCRGNASCTTVALIASAIIGVITAFLQITAVITVAPVFLWVVFGVAVAYLAALVLATLIGRRAETASCVCSTLGTLLIGILGSILFAVVLLAVGIVATSVISAILVGLLLFFFALIFAASACLVRCVTNCNA